MARNYKLLVYGAGGAQGRTVVNRALAEGYEVRGLGRASRNSVPGAEYAQADLGDAEALVAATQGADGVVFMLPLAFDAAQAERWTTNALRAAERARVKTFVFDTSAPVPDIACGVPAIDLKVRAERLVRAADLATTIVRPTLYLGNLLAPWAAPAIVNDGVLAYPLPENARAAWISWEDVAAAVVAAARGPGLGRAEHHLGGPKALDGPGLATAIGSGLGRRIDYISVPLDAFEAGLTQAMGPEVGREIAALYRWFGGEGRELLARTGEIAADALGLTLTDARSWAAGQNWAAHAAPAPAGVDRSERKWDRHER